MYRNKQQNQDRLGKQMIHSCGIELIEAAHIIHELHHCMGANQELDAQNCIRRLREAREILQEMNPCITLEQGVLSLLEGKKHRRSSTRRELKYYTMKKTRNWPREKCVTSPRACVVKSLKKLFPKKAVAARLAQFCTGSSLIAVAADGSGKILYTLCKIFLRLSTK